MTAEHPFAEFIKILGKGKKGARDLTLDEAYRAMHMILKNEVEPIQLGAFLMLIRIKEETQDELAGFVKAAREHTGCLDRAPKADLDWSSYAGKRRQLPWFILASQLLAENGYRVFMHGAGGHTEGRLYTETALKALNIEPATSLAESETQLEQTGFSYLSLQHICQPLYDMINLRPVMGLRSPVHTLVRLLNPMNADYSIQGIFHPSYRQVHQNAALILNQPHMAVLKGEGGETERNPDVECLVQSVHLGQLDDELWPALFSRRHMKADELNPAHLAAVWKGEKDDELGVASVTATVAVTLKLLGRCDDQSQSQLVAEQLWQQRNKGRFD